MENGANGEQNGKIHHPWSCAHDGYLVFIVGTSTRHVITVMLNFVQHNDYWYIKISFLMDWICGSALAKHRERNATSKKPALIGIDDGPSGGSGGVFSPTYVCKCW